MKMHENAKMYNENNLTGDDRYEITQRYLRFVINLVYAKTLAKQRGGKSTAELIPEMHELATLKAFLDCTSSDHELVKILYEMEGNPEQYEFLMGIGYDKR